MTMKKALLSVFVLINLLFGYPLFFVFGYEILYERRSILVHFLNIFELLVYILLVSIINGIVIRQLKSDWVRLVMAAIFLFFLSAYLGSVIIDL